MKKLKGLICCLLLLSMIASMFLVINADKGSSRSGISIDRVTTKNKVGESATYPEGYYVTDKRLDSAPVTFEFWAYIPASVWNTANGVVLSNWVEIGAPTNTNDWFTLSIEPKGCPRLAIGYSDGRCYDKTFGSLIQKDTWTHISMILDQKTRKLKVYVNGVAEGQLTFGEGSKASILNKNLDSMIYFLGDARRGNNRAMYDIKISDVAVYSDVRTSDEIKSDYSSGADVKDKDLILYYEISGEDKRKDIKDASGNGYDMKYNRTFLTDTQMNVIRENEGKDYAYSMALIPDTHFWVGYPAAKQSAIFDYVINNRKSQNIQYVIGLGDMTGDGKEAEWPLVKKEYARLDKAGIPYSVVRGNHDTIKDSSYFNALFGEGTPFFEYVEENGGFYKDGSSVNTYICFKANEKVDYLMLNLDFGINKKVLAWANKVIVEHPDHRVIVVSHSWLGSSGKILDTGDFGAPSMYDTNYLDPAYIWENCFSKHENIDMIVCGHTHSDQILTTPIVGKNGNVVYQVLVNNQCSPDYFKGLGNVAIMNFTADGRFANIAYYSTIHDKYFYEGSSDIIFDFDATASATVDIGGKVSLTGRDIASGEFELLLHSADSKFAVDSSKAPVKVTNTADGSFCFKSVTFDKEGEYYFVLCANTSVGAKNVKIDESVYHVSIKVDKDRNGILQATKMVIAKKDGTQAQNTVEFINEYTGAGITIWICAGVGAIALGALATVLILVRKKKRAKNSN